MSSQPSRFAKTHEWVAVDGDTATIGITDFAVKLLSDLVFVDLPKPGKKVAQGESFGEIESVKHVSDLYSPVTGTVTEVNTPLADNLEWLQQDPHAKAWMIKVKMANPAEVDGLLDAAAYQAHCESESH
ncbi:MAG TPA: glycine cleavage system protein GcvH [Planctomycetaceae bacterium]|nr:glycine cleavage system protein GcvH [Planctomycetaceae bacterium]